MATDIPYIYPELVGYHSRDREVGPPPTPNTCPICAAPSVHFAKDEHFVAERYACGGTYSLKPQIQNHTDYYWGTCPPAARLVALHEANAALKVIALDEGTKFYLKEHDPKALEQVKRAIYRLDNTLKETR